jgi:hypothetical protein
LAHSDWLYKGGDEIVKRGWTRIGPDSDAYQSGHTPHKIRFRSSASSFLFPIQVFPSSNPAFIEAEMNALSLKETRYLQFPKGEDIIRMKIFLSWNPERIRVPVGETIQDAIARALPKYFPYIFSISDALPEKDPVSGEIKANYHEIEYVDRIESTALI